MNFNSCLIVVGIHCYTKHAKHQLQHIYHILDKLLSRAIIITFDKWQWDSNALNTNNNSPEAIITEYTYRITANDLKKHAQKPS